MSPVQLLVAAVRASIENLTPAQLATELDDPFVLLVDVREPTRPSTAASPTRCSSRAGCSSSTPTMELPTTSKG
jgi:hypothetical protein